MPGKYLCFAETRQDAAACHKLFLAMCPHFIDLFWAFLFCFLQNLPFTSTARCTHATFLRMYCFLFFLVCHELGLFLQQVRYNGKVFFRHMIFQAQHVVIFHWASAQNVRTFVLLLVILHWKHHKQHTILHFFAVFHLWFLGKNLISSLEARQQKQKSLVTHNNTYTMHMVTKFMGFPFPVMTTI